MIRQPVVSTNLCSVGYDETSRTLEIEFHGGEVYQYFDVPKTVYSSLMSASSQGSYIHRYIKDRYRWKRIL